MLRERVLTALVLGTLLVVLVFWAPATVLAAVISAALMLGAFEWAQFCGWTQMPARLGYAVAIAAAMFAANYWLDSPAAASIFAVAAGWWLIALIWVAAVPRANPTLAVLVGILVLVPAWLALMALHRVPEIGRQLILFLLLLVVAADIGAYFSGRAFGRIKLAPRVSPGKTWEGALGGVVGAQLIAVAGAYWFAFPFLPFIALCLGVTVASIVGDLTESMFKRSVGLKDSGTLLPGHGGILDRLDSITAAAPVFALGVTWLGSL